MTPFVISFWLAFSFSLRMDSLVKWKIRSRNGSSPENVADGPPLGKRRMAGELKTVSRRKSGDLEIFLDPLVISAKVLKKFQKEVPSVTAWLTVSPMKIPSPISVTCVDGATKIW